MAEFQIGDHTYRSGQMDARMQFHVMRRLATVLDALKDMPRPAAPKDGEDAVVEKTEADWLEAIAPLAKAIGRMPEDDVDYVLDSCMSICERQSGNGWAKIWNMQVKRSMFSDIDMAVTLQITLRVLQESFAGFFRGLPSSLSGAAGE